MGRGGAHKDRSEGPFRTCIATGQELPKSRLIRFVLGPDATAVPDVTGKLPGRGLYVVPDRAALDRAAAKKLFSRGFKTQTSVPDGLSDLVERMVVRRVVDLISLARKSGDAVSGYEKVKDWLSKEEAEILIQAEDGSARGKSKLSTPYGGSYIGWLTADELGMAFGRQSAIHAALRAGGLAPRVVEEAQRLKGLRIGHADAASGDRGRPERMKKLNER
ncbi:RNA-binding protein [Cognatishimia sp. F0-27]|uniref:RNA-binding protein n=1 Tax=Cognatishimia sp. F0-27 TaxID=2816855 RepID=UPI001D0CC834|nr:RNA-binding protein [Cognatishimia sp. F0-27]MCC1493043.1 RNA-binding protein [Cognatishimia sp. F0-27]